MRDYTGTEVTTGMMVLFTMPIISGSSSTNYRIDTGKVTKINPKSIVVETAAGEKTTIRSDYVSTHVVAIAPLINSYLSELYAKLDTSDKFSNCAIATEAVRSVLDTLYAHLNGTVRKD